MDVQHPGDFPSTESHGLGKVVAEGEYSQYNKNVEVLFGGQAQFVVPLNLPHHLHLAAIGKHLRALDFDLANTLADSTLQYGKGDGGEIFFLYGKVDKCRFGVVFGHVWAFRTQSASSVFVTLVRHFVLQIYDQARAEPLFLLVSTHQAKQRLCTGFFLYGKVDKCRFGVVFGHVWAFRTQSASSVFVTLVRHFVLQIYDQARGEPLFLLVSTHQTNQNSLPRASQCWCWLGLTKT